MGNKRFFLRDTVMYENVFMNPINQLEKIKNQKLCRRRSLITLSRRIQT